MTSYSFNQPTPIYWYSYIHWLKRTLDADRYLYQPQPKKSSVNVVERFMWPALERPIFLIGSPRSGTTFLGSCLSTLLEVSYHHEPIATKAAARYVYENEWSFDQSKAFYRSIYRWLLRIHGEGHLRFVEKTPRNCLIVPFLQQAFPKAQFIYLVRDGRDAALSHSQKPWLQAAMANSGKREPGGYLYGPYARFWVEQNRRSEFESTSDLHRCIWNWRVFNQHAIATLAMLSSQSLLRINYEDLVVTPQAVGETILRFLGIDNDQSRTALMQALQQARPDSVGAWQRQLSPAQIQLIHQEAGSCLATLGYNS
jgi:Sulfotransferase family